MGKKTWKSVVSLFMAAALIVTSLGMTNPLTADAATDGAKAPSAEGRAVTGDNGTYYIDAAGGSDENDGKSENKAWKTFKNVPTLRLGAGGKVLLKAGCTWNGEKLMIQNAKGTEQSPVILGKYGEGANPKINGQGSKWLDTQDRANLSKEDVAAVHIQNSEYITIQNLEVTNLEEDRKDLEGKLGRTNVNPLSPGVKITHDQSKYMLTGILVENHDAGELKGVKIENNYVHDVNGYMSRNNTEGHKKGSGGIMVLVTGGSTESYFKDLEISGNEVTNVCHEAIYMESCWAARTLVGGASSQQAGSKPWVGWPNVNVNNNYVHDVAGDGIVLINADGGKAKNNLVTGCASEEWYYDRNPAHAAIWAWDCNNVTFENNEAAYTQGTQDSMAFDSDYGNQNVLFQYNYSHNNKGGFWMACPGPYYSINSVVRYNVSVNDGGYDGSRILWVGESGSIGHQVYNNTMYWDDTYKGIQAVKQGSWLGNTGATAKTSGTDIYNNIFYGDSVLFVNHEGVNYKNNCVWGGSEKAYPWEEDLTGMAANPYLKDISAEGHSTGTFAKGAVTLGKTEGMELTAQSPCIDAGIDYMEVPDESFTEVEEEKVASQITLENKDYKGNAVPYKAGATATAAEKPDIGAFEFQGASTGDYTSGEDRAWVQTIIDLAKGLDPEEFEAASMTNLNDVVTKTEAALTANPVQLTAMKYRLEYALMNMKKAGEGGSGSAANNILSAADSGFESGDITWGGWAASGTVSVSASEEQKHTGNKSWKINYADASSSKVAYSEHPDIEIQPNTEYVLEAWMYCANADDVSKVGLEAKHHNSITDDKADHKLVDAKLTADVPDAENPGWYKISLRFTTENYNKIRLAFSSEIATVYADDVVLYPAVSTGTKLDRTNLEAALAQVPEYEESEYPTVLWDAYQEAIESAKLVRVNPTVQQADIDNAATALNTAYNALAKKAQKKGLLQAYYTVQATKEKGRYTDLSWNRFQTALKNAKAVLDDAEPTQTAVDKALADLKIAVNRLVEDPIVIDQKKDQAITVTGSLTKTHGDAAFSIGARTNGDGALSYASSDAKVAAVDAKSGRVTLKGAGVCTITVTASETANYNAKIATVALTVNPKKAALKKLKTAKGRKLTVSWSKDATVTGYEVQCALKKNFKSGLKKATIKKAGTTSTSFKKLTKNKKYYVRIRAYKNVKVNGKTVKLTGTWSNVKTSGKIKK